MFSPSQRRTHWRDGIFPDFVEGQEIRWSVWLGPCRITEAQRIIFSKTISILFCLFVTIGLTAHIGTFWTQ